MSATAIERIGIVGLGVMGGALARALLASGVAVVGHDIETARMDALVAAGGLRGMSARNVAERVDIVLLVLPSSAALDSVATGPGGLTAAARDGRIVVEMSTLAISDKERLRDRLEPLGTAVLDCPISGTAVQAERGDIVIYASGNESAIARCQPIFRKLARQVIAVGTFGTASRIKFLANHLVAVHVAAAGEALALARKAGIDVDVALQALTAGAGSSRMLEVRGPMMAARRYLPPSMTTRLFQKDLRIIAEFAQSVGVPVPLLAAASQLFAEAMEVELGEFDTASVHEVSLRAGMSGGRASEVTPD